MAARGQTEVWFDEAYFDQIMKSAGVGKLTNDVGEKVLAIAKANAPVDSGAYKNGLGLRKVTRKYRNAVIVEGVDPKTLLIESKTGNLARALKSAGRG